MMQHHRCIILFFGHNQILQQTVGGKAYLHPDFVQKALQQKKKITRLLECHRAISMGFRWKECSMFMKTQRSAEKTIYFLDSSAESILALFLRAPHSTVIHLYATGFIYTLQTFIKANLTR